MARARAYWFCVFFRTAIASKFVLTFGTQKEVTSLRHTVLRRIRMRGAQQGNVFGYARSVMSTPIASRAGDL